MFSFLATHPPRTRNAHNNPVYFDEGNSSIEFKAPSDRYLVVNRWPPFPAGSSCALKPPLHWHRFQREEFHVLHGVAKFTVNESDQFARAGDIIVVPPGAVHTFCNASELESMTVEFVLDPFRRERDEAFFRNIQGYRDDCRKAGKTRSIFQVLLFNFHADAVLAGPGPAWLSKPLGIACNFIGGLVIGRWILGYQSNYVEYYHPSAY